MLLIVNHKANINYEDIIKYEKRLRKLDLIVLPSHCYLPIFKKGKYKLGSQDISSFKEKNRTGELNGEQLQSLNIKYSLIGHSDRRIYNKEKDEILLNKLHRCYENNIVPIYCIGNIVEDSNEDELKKQIDLYYENFTNENVIIAYEPKENIGNDNADLSSIEKTINFIKNYINDKYKKNISLVYGGGVRKNNIKYIKNINNLDGVIISTESLNINELELIYKETKK